MTILYTYRLTETGYKVLADGLDYIDQDFKPGTLDTPFSAETVTAAAEAMIAVLAAPAVVLSTAVLQ